MIPYSFHPEAAAELEDASAFYESCSTGLGSVFAAEVEHTIDLVRQFPDAGAPVGAGRRRVLVARFPYSVVYRHEPELIAVFAVVHQRRRPGYWRRRK
ncbi:MAG: type II toxin-antitoxin system RelE/ParE family toxin [Proteobacteria bacterium]|nr:type II toxin-antitoxin system RelE/ParE family toxin [Pseudomonadota bacterium]